MVQILAPSLAKALWLSGGQSEGACLTGAYHSLARSLTHGRTGNTARLGWKVQCQGPKAQPRAEALHLRQETQ